MTELLEKIKQFRRNGYNVEVRLDAHRYTIELFTQTDVQRFSISSRDVSDQDLRQAAFATI